MEYQRVNEIFRNYMFFCHKNLVTDIIALYEIVPNEDKSCRMRMYVLSFWKRHVFEGWQRWQGSLCVKLPNQIIASICNTEYYLISLKRERTIYVLVFVNRWQCISKRYIKVTTFVNVCQRNNLIENIWYVVTYPLSTPSTPKCVLIIFWNALNKKGHPKMTFQCMFCDFILSKAVDFASSLQIPWPKCLPSDILTIRQQDAAWMCYWDG